MHQGHRPTEFQGSRVSLNPTPHWHVFRSGVNLALKTPSSQPGRGSIIGRHFIGVDALPLQPDVGIHGVFSS
jgi:hypothetical protein